MTESISVPPYWTTRDEETVRIYWGNAVAVLADLPDASVHTVVTSPPYWGLRDYNTGSVAEIGGEPTLDQFVSRLVNVFTQVRRVLRDDGTLWLNLGDSYKDGELTCAPWRVALALQANGWMLRQDIIWSKPNPMPDSVKNRCTKSHEYIFLLTKGKGYYYDSFAIKEESTSKSGKGITKGVSQKYGDEIVIARSHSGWMGGQEGIRNKRSVWEVPLHSYPGAHFATYPPKLIEPCILAGTSEKGCCPECGKGWQRVLVEKGGNKIKGESGFQRDRSLKLNRNGVDSTLDGGEFIQKETVGWAPDCECYGVKVVSPYPTDRESPRYSYLVEKWWEWWNILKPEYDTLDTVPCVVLDPFFGSGTTAEVAIKNKRHCWGIELSKSYIVYNAIPRLEGVMQSIPRLRDQVIPPGKSMLD